MRIGCAMNWLQVHCGPLGRHRTTQKWEPLASTVVCLVKILMISLDLASGQCAMRWKRVKIANLEHLKSNSIAKESNIFTCLQIQFNNLLCNFCFLPVKLCQEFKEIAKVAFSI